MAVEKVVSSSRLWFQRGIGQELHKREIAATDRTVNSMSVERLLQLSGLPFWDYFPRFHYLHYDLAKSPPIPGHNIIGDFSSLGILADTIDVVVVPHLHEVYSDFDKVLAEIMRVLRYDGIVIFFGFNPLSLWGMQRILGFNHVVPWCSKFYSAGTVIKKFEDFDFTYIERENLYPGFYSNVLAMHRLCYFLEEYNVSSMGAVYKLVFKKSFSTMTLNTEKNKFYHHPSSI